MGRSELIKEMRKRGFEPLRLKSHWTLNPARLPVPPLPLI